MFFKLADTIVSLSLHQAADLTSIRTAFMLGKVAQFDLLPAAEGRKSQV
jgi:hypothetical protein